MLRDVSTSLTGLETLGSRLDIQSQTTDLPYTTTQGGPTLAEQTRPRALTPEAQQAWPPVKSSPPFLPLQPEPAQDPQVVGQHTSFAGIPVHVDPADVE